MICLLGVETSICELLILSFPYMFYDSVQTTITFFYQVTRLCQVNFFTERKKMKTKKYQWLFGNTALVSQITVRIRRTITTFERHELHTCRDYLGGVLTSVCHFFHPSICLSVRPSCTISQKPYII